MKYLPDDLVQYLRSNRLGQKQKSSIRELALECRQSHAGGAEYADRYVRRSLKILESTNTSLRNSQG